MNRRRHCQLPARILLAVFCCLRAALGQPTSTTAPLETGEFPVDAFALRYNLDDLTNWGIGPATFPAAGNFVIIEHPRTHDRTGFGTGGFGNAGFGSKGFTRLTSAPPETINREVQSALREHFTRAGLDFGANTGNSIAFDYARQTVTITAPSAEMAAIARDLKKIGRYIPEVNIKMKVMALPVLAREPAGLEAIDQLGLHHRFTVESGGFSLDKSNTTSPARPFFVHLSDPAFRQVIGAFTNTGKAGIIGAPEVTSESLRLVQMVTMTADTIIPITGGPFFGTSAPAFSPPPTPTTYQQFYSALQRRFGLDIHHNADFELDLIPAISEDENSIRLQRMQLTFWTAPWNDFPRPTNSPPIILNLPLRDLTLADQDTICIGNLVTKQVLFNSPPGDTPGHRALAGRNLKHVLIFLTATVVNPDGTRYHTNAVPPATAR